MTVDFETATRLLSYDKTTGEVFWTSSARKNLQGKKAGSLRPNGYRQISVLGTLYLEHRLVWLLVNGVFPKGQVDHINGDRLDNRIENLRDVSRVVNQQNIRRAKLSNLTGLLGVSKNGNGWQSHIRIYGKRKHLGTFPTPHQAYEAYVLAKRQYHEGCTI